MLAPREFHHRDDSVAITIDIEDCPLVEFPLCEVFDYTTSSLVEDYLEVFHNYVTQILEDTPWLDKQSTSILLRASIGVFYRRNEREIVSMRKPALQRLIAQYLHARVCVRHPIEMPIFIRLLRPEIDLPCKTKFPPPVPRGTNVCADTNCDCEIDCWGSGASYITRDDTTTLIVDSASSTTRDQLCGSVLVKDGIEATVRNAALTAGTAQVSRRDINLDDTMQGNAIFADFVALIVMVDDRVHIKPNGYDFSLNPPGILPSPIARILCAYLQYPSLYTRQASSDKNANRLCLSMLTQYRPIDRGRPAVPICFLPS
jgi:hypothetical protein